MLGEQAARVLRGIQGVDVEVDEGRSKIVSHADEDEWGEQENLRVSGESRRIDRDAR